MMLSNHEISERIPKTQLSTLLKVSNLLASSLDLNFVLQTAIVSTVELLGLDTGAIYQLQDHHLFLGATTPPLAPELDWLLLQPERIQDHPHLLKAFRSRRPVLIEDAMHAELSRVEAEIRDARKLRSILYIPLLSEEKAIGALIVGTTTQVRSFSDDEIDLCCVLSSQISLAVINARLYRSLQKANAELVSAYDTTLLGWSLALEMRDHETKVHTLRVEKLTDDLAKKLGIPSSERVNIRRGALLHDIGKMGVPDQILRKPGPLNSEEWRIMQKHCEYAYQFLLQIEYLLPAIDIPYCHHEKWDGSGYPRGLKGEEIPFSARIFAVADVYDALMSDRSYRKAWDVKDVLAYFREQSGIHFDPVVVDIFLSEGMHLG